MASHPHDRMFKKSLQNPAVLEGILKQFVPVEILPYLDNATLRFCDRESEGIRGGRKNFDLVVEAAREESPFRIQIVVEHKSWKDPGSLFQILEYKTALWARQRRDKKDLTPILPILFYHGTNPWKGERSFQGVFQFPAEFRSVCADFSPVFVDLALEEEKALLDRAPNLETALVLAALKYSRHRKKMEEAIRTLFEDRTPGKTILIDPVLLGDVIEYYASVFGFNDPDELEGAIESIFGREAVMTAVDKIRREEREKGVIQGIEKGIERGIEQGIERGIAKGRVERDIALATKLLSRGQSPEEVAALLDRDSDWVRKVVQTSQGISPASSP